MNAACAGIGDDSEHQQHQELADDVLSDPCVHSDGHQRLTDGAVVQLKGASEGAKRVGYGDSSAGSDSGAAGDDDDLNADVVHD